MKLLYKVAITHVHQLIGEEAEKAEVIELICENTKKQIEKIKRSVQHGNGASVEKAILYFDDTSEYLTRQKRKHTIGRSTTPIPETPPIKYLKTTQPDQATVIDYDFIELVDYVKLFKSKNSGRVNWKQCSSHGHEQKKAVIMQFQQAKVLYLNITNVPALCLY